MALAKQQHSCRTVKGACYCCGSEDVDLPVAEPGESQMPCLNCIEEIDKAEEAFWESVKREDDELKRRRMIIEHYAERQTG